MGEYCLCGHCSGPRTSEHTQYWVSNTNGQINLNKVTFLEKRSNSYKKNIASFRVRLLIREKGIMYLNFQKPFYIALFKLKKLI